MAAASKWTYFFGNGKAEGKGDAKELLGGKGAGLAEMTRIGLPVPAGFTIATDACRTYHEKNGKWPTGLEKEVRAAMGKLERACKKKFGAATDPLLVSVRSGAAKSMPGMMETILNLGLNDESVEGLAKASDNRWFAFDAYRRLIMMYGATAKGIDRNCFEGEFDELKENRTRVRLGAGPNQDISDSDVNGEELELLVDRFKHIYQEQTGESFPQDPIAQLKGAIDAVLESWMAEKAVTYRRVERITGLNGTAVNICQMVFGNMGEDCGTGVCFTRDPSTGECTFFGDVLMNAQGEDVVAGVRTPLKLDDLAEQKPDIYDQLVAMRVILELHYRDMQDLEFTFEGDKLYMLQTRAGKRSPVAAFKIAVDQATKGLITAAEAKKLVKKKYLPAKYATAATKPIISKDEAISRIDPADVERLFFPVVDPSLPAEQLASQHLGTGIGAVPGAACGIAVFSAEEAELRAKTGTTVILIRRETSPEDVGGMHVAAGILTATGGKTSHAAVVARGWGKCCIVGCDALTVNEEEGWASLNGEIIRQGSQITLDGSSGRVFDGRLALVKPDAPAEYRTLMEWCDQRRRLRVRANADTPADAARAVELGAEGIGLCRTEHMFFDPSEAARLTAMREMILAEDTESRQHALAKLLPYQREDFEGVFKAMKGLPVTIRLLDPPLHEFLPQHDNRDGQHAVVQAMNQRLHAELAEIPPWQHEQRQAVESRMISIEDLQHRVDTLHETNPMLGHRGCRLCITHPEILDMQVRAIMEAAANCKEQGIKVAPEIMIPLTIDAKELRILIDRVREVADGILKERKVKISYQVGTMIETPRAALTAERLAETAEFFSFGTNDLTQLTMGLSRDDAGKFLPVYIDQDKAAIFSSDPFQTIDEDGVGVLVKLAVEKGRQTRRHIKLGICGEHGGDQQSVFFCELVGLDYVSCSPPRVPVARLAAAQASIRSGTKGKSTKGQGRSPAKRVANAKPKAARSRPKASGGAKRTKKSGKKKKRSLAYA